MKTSKISNKTKRRLYYLMNKVREAGFEVDAPSREVNVSPYTRLYDIPVGPRYYVQQLIKAGYNIQLKLL